MHSQKHNADRNIQKLREVEVLISQGMNPDEASHQAGVNKRIFYQWRKEYGRIQVDQSERFIDLEKENLRLKQLMADKGLATPMLTESRSEESKNF